MAKKQKRSTAKKTSVAGLRAQLLAFKRDTKALHLSAVKLGRVGGLTTAIRKRTAKKATKKTTVKKRR